MNRWERWLPLILLYLSTIWTGCDATGPDGGPDVPSFAANLYPKGIARQLEVENVTIAASPPGSGRMDFHIQDNGRNVVSLYHDPCSLVELAPDGSGRQERPVLSGCSPEAPAVTIHRFMTDDRLFALRPDRAAMKLYVQVADLEGTSIGAGEIPLETTPEYVHMAMQPDHTFAVLVGRGWFGYDDTPWINQVTAFTATGQERWTTTLPAPGDSVIHVTDLAARSGGGYLALANRSRPFQSAELTLLFSLDEDGRVVDTQHIRPPGTGALTQIEKIGDDRYLLAGNHQQDGAGYAWFREIDATGTVIWDSETRWDAWYRQYLYTNQLHPVLVATRRQDGGIDLVARDAYNDAHEFHTYQVGAEGRLLQAYAWPFAFTAVPEARTVSCTPEVFRPGPGGRLRMLGTCMDIQRTSRFEWKSVIQTTLFTLE